MRDTKSSLEQESMGEEGQATVPTEAGIRLEISARGKEGANARGEVVADAAESGEFFFVRAGGGAGIPDAPVDELRSARKDGAKLGSGIANGDDGVKLLALEFGGGFGTMGRDVEAEFMHGFDGQRTDIAVGPGSGTVNFVGGAAEMAEEAFGHLASHAIAGAEDEDAVCHGDLVGAQHAAPQLSAPIMNNEHSTKAMSS